jgi:hypothetical protein
MIPAYFNTTNRQKSFMNLRTFFIADSKSPVLMQPRNGSLNNPAIYPQTTAVFGSTLCQDRFDSFLSKFLTMRFRVITSISKNSVRLASGTPSFACYRRNTIKQWQQLCNIMPISSGQFNRQRKSVAICYQMMFRAFFAAVRRIWAGFCPPKTARTEDESTMAREKSIWSAWFSLSRRLWCILSHTPAFCQSRNLLQQVMPQPQPISLGRSSHPIPVLSTNKIPVSASLSETGFRPGYLKFLFLFGRIGSIISHNLSSSIGFAMSNLLVFWLLLLSAIKLIYLSFC